ncbi:protein lin-10-like isoform X2 [Eriocheir sinensis]|uniref:protein lin-10-like isoform X2 n=1 Tax=Eriocheir sinensis TaxID=95602 RepID=UPI0021C5EE5D|nr:protein lin-10-like isoform X2 [Eriocheir sinensis]
MVRVMNGGLVQRLAELNLIRDPATVGTKTLVITRPRQQPAQQPQQEEDQQQQQDDGDTDQETDRLLGQQRSDDPGFYDEKGWRRPKTRTAMPRPPNHKANGGGATNNGSTPSTPIGQGQQVPSNQTPSPPPDMAAPNKTKNKKEKETNKKKGRSKEVMIHEPAVLIEGVLFRARYLGSTQLVSEGQPTKTTRMMQAEEAVSRIKDADDDKEALAESNGPDLLPSPPQSPSPKHSPLPHQSPVSRLTPGDSDSFKEFLSRNGSPQNLNPPVTAATTVKSFASPSTQEQPKAATSPSQGRDYSRPPSEASSQHGKVWKPGHRVNQGALATPYVGDVSLAAHPGVPLAGVLPPGVLEEPIRNPDSLNTAAERMEVPTDGGGDDDYEVEDDEREHDDEVEDEECRENQQQMKRTEEEEEEEDEDDDEEEEEEEEEQEEEDEEEEDEEEDEEGGDKHSSMDSEDQCIEVLTVLPSASGGAQRDGEQVVEADGGGGSLDWVSEEGGGPGLGPAGTVFHLRLVGSVDVAEESGKAPARKTACKRPKKDMVMEAVSHLKAPDGESQPSTEVDLFISTEKIMVLNTDLKEIMMDHALRTISYIADIGDLVVLMARRRVLPTDDATNGIQKTPKMICHVFESDEAQFIAQSIGQAFQVAYLEFLKANGIEDHSFVKEMDYQEVLNSQEIFGDELQMFAKKELQKEVVVPKMKSEILGVVVVESGWGSMVPTVVIANLSPTGAAAKCGQLNIGDQIIAINGVSLVGLPLSTCQNYIKNTKYNTAVKLTVVPCPPVVEVKIRRPDTKYQLGFSVQNGVICSLLRGGIAERGGVRVGHRIIDINSQSVVAVPHEKIVNLLATSVGEIRMKTMPTSIFRLLTGQETPQYI